MLLIWALPKLGDRGVPILGNMVGKRRQPAIQKYLRVFIILSLIKHQALVGQDSRTRNSYRIPRIFHKASNMQTVNEVTKLHIFST